MTNEELAIKIQAGETDLLVDLWEQNLGLVNTKAYGLFNSCRDVCNSSGIELDDVIQLCFLALVDAVQGFDPEQEYKLTSYINYPLKNHFRALTGIRSSKRNPLNTSKSLNERVGDEDTELIEFVKDSKNSQYDAVIDDVYNSELRDELEKAISCLSDKGAYVIRSRYFKDKLQREIALEMGVTGSYIRELEFKALQKLKRYQGLRSFHEEIMSTYAWRGFGLKIFKSTGSSSVERAVIKAEKVFHKHGLDKKGRNVKAELESTLAEYMGLARIVGLEYEAMSALSEKSKFVLTKPETMTEKDFKAVYRKMKNLFTKYNELFKASSKLNPRG